MSTRTQLTVVWNVEPDTDAPITGYVLEVDYIGDGQFTTLWNGTGRPDILSYTLTVNTGSTYYFRHYSMNANGASPYSDVVAMIACDTPSSPGTP